MASDAGDALVAALHEHNPWWAEGVDAFDLPAREKSDFYHLARPDGAGSQFEDQRLLGLVGRRGAGKTTLLHQFVRHRIDAGDPPERFLYLPCDADPLYQLRSDEQLRRAVRYYEGRVLGRLEAPDPHFVLIDDVHQVEHPNKPAVEGWGHPVTAMLDAEPGRHVAVTASAAVQVTRELDRVGFPEAAVDTQPILPEKFRDYVFSLYPTLETADRRVSPTSIRTGERSLPAVLRGEATVADLAAELTAKAERVDPDTGRVRSRVGDYLAMGGTLAYGDAGAVDSPAALPEGAFTDLRADVRAALYQEVPGFDSVRTIADLERLCALAARSGGAEGLRYSELVDLFDVDRRTIADSYLPALAELYVCTGVTEYDNARPREVRLYLRDPGLVTAFGGDGTDPREGLSRETDRARVTAFDHTMRLAYGVNAAQGVEADPDVRFWHGGGDVVDFVFEVDGDPVPVALAYRPPVAARRDAVRAFLDAYDAPVGLVVTGETVGDDGDGAVTRHGRLLEVPYWLYLLLC